MRREKINPDAISRISFQVKSLEDRIINNIDIFRKTIERVKDSNLNILTAIEVKLKEMDRTASSLSEKLDKRISRIESVLTNAITVKVVDKLEEIDCVFREDGLIVYGSYDKKFIVYATQALRVLENMGLIKLEVNRGNSIVFIGVLGRIGGKMLYCLKESSYPVRFNTEKILKELGETIG